MTTIGDALVSVKRRLASVTEYAEFEARQLLCKALCKDTASFVSMYNEPMPDDSELQLMLEKRLAGTPLQYILSEWEFMGLPMDISQQLLIPRPETELAAETVLNLSKSRGYTDVLDMCCGTGCIGIALAKHGKLNVTCSDVCSEAIEYTLRNAEKNSVKINVSQGDLFENICNSYDVIVCNPPYIPTAELSKLQAEVQHEPRLALDGGRDGLFLYRRIAHDAPKFIRPGGALVLEAGIDQAEKVIALLGKGYSLPDLSGIPRVVVAEY